MTIDALKCQIVGAEREGRWVRMRRVHGKGASGGRSVTYESLYHRNPTPSLDARSLYSTFVAATHQAFSL